MGRRDRRAKSKYIGYLPFDRTGRSGRWCRGSTGRGSTPPPRRRLIGAQIADDDAEAMRDAAAWARRVRRKIGLPQVAFTRCATGNARVGNTGLLHNDDAANGPPEQSLC
jgi:hypothetical protein